MAEDTKQVCQIGYTTDDISSSKYVLAAVEILGQMFGRHQMVVSWCDLNGNESCGMLNEMDEEDVNNVHRLGGISVADKNSRAFDFGITWRRPDANQAGAILRNLGKVQNTYSLFTPIEFVEDPQRCGRYLKMTSALARLFNVNYVQVGHTKFNKIGFSTKDQLEVGLRDTFWAAVYGRPYVDLMGNDVFKSLKCILVEEIHDGMFMVVLTETMPNDVNGHRQLDLKWRKMIGESYFTKENERCDKHGGVQRGGLITLIKTMIDANRSFKNRSIHADKSPCFDYSEIFSDV